MSEKAFCFTEEEVERIIKHVQEDLGFEGEQEQHMVELVASETISWVVACLRDRQFEAMLKKAPGPSPIEQEER